MVQIYRSIRRPHWRHTAVKVRCVQTIVCQFYSSQRAMFMYRIGHSSVGRNIFVIPKPALKVRTDLGAWMNLYLLCTNNRPATLGFDATQCGFRFRVGMAETGTMGYLKKAVTCSDRTNGYRLKEHIKFAGLRHRCCLFTQCIHSK